MHNEHAVPRIFPTTTTNWSSSRIIPKNADAPANHQVRSSIVAAAIAIPARVDNIFGGAVVAIASRIRRSGVMISSMR